MPEVQYFDPSALLRDGADIDAYLRAARRLEHEVLASDYDEFMHRVWDTIVRAQLRLFFEQQKVGQATMPSNGPTIGVIGSYPR